MSQSGYNPALAVLGAMLGGIAIARSVGTLGDESDVSVLEMDEARGRVADALVELASGDRYRVTVEWLEADSP